ncbi:SRPBCC family protein [Jatrophihabitans sp.]|uniref:SRPBCC family protein n=1 Tax=Jatrophihabitans sp. TaxID=1932789 RepID=UPI002C25A8E1|nr:SRPBCC family protein [Jatrophihabitans sp.]
MADYLADADIAAPADELFDYLSEVGNLPDYFDRMTSATDNGDGTIAVAADLGDQVVEGEAWLKIDRDSKTLTWGSEGPNNYSGQLQVSGDGDRSRVEITLRTERAAGEEIQQGLERTVSTIKAIVEGR